ncbi:MAG: carbohydrate binding domain-containing protein [Candidatus Schekmanbacteria bacterium]|nr:carbohydrate binding domain-containing protein [Candidatus Schekmanbacteria bacterium]
MQVKAILDNLASFHGRPPCKAEMRTGRTRRRPITTAARTPPARPVRGALALASAMLLLLSGAVAAHAAPTATGRDSVSAALARFLAERHIGSFRGFENRRISHLTPLVHPRTRQVMYFEADLATDDAEAAGSIVLSATRRDAPIVEFAPRGKSRREQLQERLGRPDLYLVYFSPGYSAAIDAAGNLRGELGQRPQVLPGELRVHSRSEGRVGEGRDVHSQSGGSSSVGRTRPAASDDSSFAALADAYDERYRRGGQHRERRLAARWQLAEQAFARAAATTPTSRLRNAATVAATASTPAASFDYYFAQDYDYDKAISEETQKQNHTYFKQLPGDHDPNPNSYYSGCSATSWMNLIGWYDLHWKPGILTGAHEQNISPDDSYINDMTVELSEYLGVAMAPFDWDAGFLWPADMELGYSFIRDRLDHDPSGSYRQDWFDTDENWVYEVARSYLIDKQLPVTVGYYEDWHYTTAFGIAEDSSDWEGDAYLWIHPNWNESESQDKWITKETIFGIWGLSAVRPIQDRGFEYQTVADALQSPWGKWGTTASVGTDIGKGLAHSDAKNAYIVTKSGSTGWNYIYQSARVEPYRRYEISLWIKTSSSFGTGYIGAREFDNTIIENMTFPKSSEYANYTLQFDSGDSDVVNVYVGYEANGQAYMRLDDVYLYAIDSVEDGNFEMQQSDDIDFPWGFSGSSTSNGGIDRNKGLAHSGQNNAYITTEGGNTDWNEIFQTITVEPNTTYVLKARVKTQSTFTNTGTIGITSDRYSDTFLAQTTFGALSSYTEISLELNSGNRYSVAVKVGFNTPPSSTYLRLDDVTVTPK